MSRRRDPRIERTFAPALDARDERALRAIHDDDAFVAEAALLRTSYAHHRDSARVSFADVHAWLQRQIAGFDAVEQLAFELFDTKTPPGVHAWLMDEALARGLERHFLNPQHDAAQLHALASAWRTLFAGALRRANSVRPGRGRPRVTDAREALKAQADRLAKRHRLSEAQRAKLLAIVFFDVAPTTIEPPTRIAALKSRPKKQARKITRLG